MFRSLEAINSYECHTGQLDFAIHAQITDGFCNRSRDCCHE